MIVEYIPERGDIVWINFNPQAGHEQSGRRPAIVISVKQYNAKAGLAIFCPITTQKKGYPFEVVIPYILKINGVILTDQIKSLDWKVRDVSFICKLENQFMQQVMSKIQALLN